MHLLTVYKQLVFNLKECTNIRNIYLKNRLKFSGYKSEYTNRTNFEQVLKLYNKVKHFNDISLSMVWNTNSFDNFIDFANVLTQGVANLQRQSSDAVTLMRTMLYEISSKTPLDIENAFYIELLAETTFLLDINNIISREYPVQQYNKIKRYINDRMTMLVDDVFLKQNDAFTRMRNIDYWKTFIAKSPIRGGASDNPSIDTTVYSHYAVYLLNKAANDPTKANVNLLLSTIYKYTSKSLLKMQFPPVSQLRRLNYEEYIKIDPRMNNPLYSTIFSMYTDPKMNDFDDGPIKRSRTSARSYSQKRKTTSLKTLSPKAHSAPAALEQPQTHPSVSKSVSVSKSANVSVSESVSANVRSSSKKSIRSTSAVNKSNNTSNANSASVDSLFGPGSNSPTTTLLPLDTKGTRNTKKKSK